MRQHAAHALSTLQNASESATKGRMYAYEYVRIWLMYNVLCFQHYALLELVPWYGLYTWWSYIENPLYHKASQAKVYYS